MVEGESFVSYLKGENNWEVHHQSQNFSVTKPSLFSSSLHFPKGMCWQAGSLLPSAGKKEEVNTKSPLNMGEWGNCVCV
jgi:hypothetical protein